MYLFLKQTIVSILVSLFFKDDIKYFL